jgi:NitT/TauT family transport system substrate-binding protein
VIHRRRAARAPWSICAAVLLLAATAVPPAPARAAASRPALRIALEAGGTLSWELRVMQELGLDRGDGLEVRPVRYATKAAAETALRGGEAEVKVDDWLFVTRARAQGIPVQAVDAFSRAVGGVVVPAGSPVRSIADLRGRRLGVTSPADKSYLVLRAVAAAQLDFDPQTASQIFTAAPPLLSRLLRRGDVDAIVQYWQFIPPLVATGRFRELVSTQALLRRIVPGADVPFLVVAATDEAVRTRTDALRAFLRALRQAKQALASRPDLWGDLSREGVLGLADPGVIPALAARYRAGLPGPWTRAAIAGLDAVTARLAAVAGADVLGVTRLDPQAYNVSLSPP